MKSEVTKPIEAQPSHAISAGCQVNLNPREEGGLVAMRRTSTDDGYQELVRSGSAQKRGFARIFVEVIGVKKSIVLAILLLVGIVAGSIWGYQTYQASQAKPAIAVTPPPVVTVSTAVSTRQTVEDNLSVTGSVWAWDPLTIGCEVGGLRITSINVEEGDHVRKGQILATLNSALLKAQLQQAKARLASSHANLGKAIQPNRPEDILALKAMLCHAEATVAQEEARRKQAGASLGNAEVISKRFTELARAGAISVQDAENRQLAADTATEEVKSADQKVNAAKYTAEQARQRLLLAERGGRHEDVEISKANISEIKAQIQHLEEQISQTYIKAPDDGLISKRDAHIGDIASAGVPMFSMVRLNRMELRAQVADLDISRIHPGQSVTVTTSENDGINDSIGKVRLVNPLVDSSTRMGTVRIDLPADTQLKPGMFVRGLVNVGHRDAVTIPAAALVTRNGESVVFKLGPENRALSTPVKVGVQTDSFVEIQEGLADGQTVIAKGARFLSDRDVVRVSK